MSRTIRTAVIAGMALGFGGVASAQSSSTISLSEAYRAEVAADAAARTSNLENGRSGFTIAAADGIGNLNVGGLVQFRYTANFRDEDGQDTVAAASVGMPDIDDNDFSHGFEVARARLDFYGNALIPNFTYRISADMNSGVRTPNGIGGAVNDLSVTYAYAEYAFEGGLEGLSVRAGVIKLPLFYEELVAPEYQLTAERSLVNEAFSQQYSEGLMFNYATDSFHVAFAVSDGLGTAATNSTAGGEADIALTARADWKIAGDWTQFEDFTSFRGSEYAARIGAAIHWESFGDTTPDSSTRAAGSAFSSIVGTNEGDILRYTIDAQVEGNGWNFYAAFLGNYESSDTATGMLALQGTEDNVNDFGVVVQGGFFVTDQVEIFGRYNGLFLDDDRFFAGGLQGEEDLHFGTLGGTYYFIPESHALKLTVDVSLAFEETTALLGAASGSTGAPTLTGWLGQDEDTEVMVRAQLQFLF